MVKIRAKPAESAPALTYSYFAKPTFSITFFASKPLNMANFLIFYKTVNDGSNASSCGTIPKRLFTHIFP